MVFLKLLSFLVFTVGFDDIYLSKEVTDCDKMTRALSFIYLLCLLKIEVKSIKYDLLVSKKSTCEIPQQSVKC